MKGTLAIKFLPAHGVMLLDPATVANLELVRNLRTGDPHQSLFGALNKCLTQVCVCVPCMHALCVRACRHSQPHAHLR